MKFPLITAALSTTYFLSSLPMTEARAYYRHYKGRPSCTDLGLCKRGGKDAWIAPSTNLLDNVMTELFRVPVSFNTLYEQSQRHQHHPTKTVSRSSSIRYDITDSDEKMELTLDLPGVHAKDISIDLLHGGKSINISALRRYKQQGGEIVTSKFEQSFTIDDSVIDVNTIEANLSEGVLIVSARKKHPQTLPSDRKIPIGTVKEDVTNNVIDTDGEHTEQNAATDEKTEKVASDDELETVDAENDLEISPEEDII